MRRIIRKIGICLKEWRHKMGILGIIYMLIIMVIRIIIISKAKQRHWKMIVDIVDKVKYHNLKSHLFKKDKADQLNYSKANSLLYPKTLISMNSHF